MTWYTLGKSLRKCWKSSVSVMKQLSFHKSRTLGMDNENTTIYTLQWSNLSPGADSSNHCVLGREGHLWWRHDCVFGATAAETSCKSECSQEHLRDTAGLVVFLSYFRWLWIQNFTGGHIFHNSTSRKVRTEIWSWCKLWYGCCSCQKVTAGHIWLYRDSAGTRFITYCNNFGGIH